MKITTKETSGGYILEISPLLEIILSICGSMNKDAIIRLNDTVMAERDMPGIPKGTLGRVIEITEPYTQGHTNDVILVRFDNEVSYHVKSKELEFKNGRYAIDRNLVTT